MRFESLGGLRGVAAAIVVIHHCFLVNPDLASFTVGKSPSTQLGMWLTFSPLHILWAGKESVYLFFLLSGFVLQLMVQGQSFRWATYYRSRFPRLYFPTWIAVLFGSLIVLIVPRSNAVTSPWLTETHPVGYSWVSLFKDFTLIGGSSGSISPLWSLRWEIIFSILLPIYWLLIRKGMISLQVIFFVGLASLGNALQGQGLTGALALLAQSLTYLPMFAIGFAFAKSWTEISSSRFAIKMLALKPFSYALALSLALSPYFSEFAVGPGANVENFTFPLSISGISLIVLLVGLTDSSKSVLSNRFFSWLGLISFSLYLVHEPIIVGMANAFDGNFVAITSAFLLSFAAAALFYFFIEQPIHKFTRRLRGN